MRTNNYLFLFLLFLTNSVFASLETRSTEPPVNVIFETDMCLDVDDVGALAVLHGLQNEGKVNLLAVCFNEVHPFGAAAIDAINTWYGRGDIPVGVYKDTLFKPDNSWYLEGVAKFPHDLDNERAASALDTYRQVLAEQPDRSVIIISVGFLNNLYDLLKDPEGYALVEKKVQLLIAMGGLNNDGFNFSRHGLVDQTQYVIENWPGTLVTTQVGGSMITGQTLTAITPVSNPVRRAYELRQGPNTGRSSWDQVSVLYAVYGTQWFNETWEGGGRLRNGYTWRFKKGYRGYAAPKDDNQVKDEIERLMTLPPHPAPDIKYGSSFTDPRDGNVYQTVTIGDQVWMAENLRYLPSVVGPGRGSRTASYYYVYDYDGTDVNAAKATENYATYGVLYNWTAALSACPTGWRIPSDAEWTQLTDYLGDDAGGKLKATGTIEAETGLWHSPNTGATNETGFTALPGGYRGSIDTFHYIGSSGAWWNATESSTAFGFLRYMYNIYSSVYSYGDYKELGFSVRCVRD